MFVRLGRLCVRRRRLVVVLWLLAFVGIGMWAPKLASTLKPGGFEIRGSESEAVRSLVAERFSGEAPSGLVIVIQADAADAESARRDVDRAAATLTRVTRDFDEIVLGVDPPLIAPDGRTGIVQVGMRHGIDQTLPKLPPLLDALNREPVSGVHVGITGGSAVFHDFDTVNEADLRRAEVIQIPLVLLVLVLVLGSLVAAGIPIVSTAISLAVTMGLLVAAARMLDMSIYVRNIVALVGIGVCVDYALFIVRRFREERDMGRDRDAAVEVTMATAGRAVFFSGLTVAVAVAGLFAVNLPIFTAFAIGSIAVVVVAVTCALTFIPSVLAILDHRVGALPVRRRRRRTVNIAETPMARWAEAVMRRPWTCLIAGSVILVLLATPALALEFGSSGSTSLPRDVPSIRAAAVIADLGGAGAVAPIRIVVDGREDSPTDATVRAVSRAAATDTDVLTTRAHRWSDDERAAVFEVISRYDEDDPRSHELVSRLRDTLAAPNGVVVLVGGAPAQNLDFNRTVGESLPRVIGLVMILTFCVLVVLFRSLLLPLKAVVMTLLSVLATYGVLVIVFQWGVGASLLGFESLGHVTAWVPPFLFSIMFGLSMDYEVFLLTRVREGRDVLGDDRRAVAWGLARSGAIITAAAAIMLVVFLCFLTNRLIPIKETALGLAVAIFLDVTIVRLLLAPAFMVLAGRWNWWLPKWLDRLLPRAIH